MTFLPSFGSFGRSSSFSSASSRSMSASAATTSARMSSRSVTVELAQHLLGRLEIAGAGAQLLRRFDDRPELAVAPRHLLVPALIREQRRVTQARFEILVLSLEVSKPIQHRSEATAEARVRRRPSPGSDPPVAFDRDAARPGASSRAASAWVTGGRRAAGRARRRRASGASAAAGIGGRGDQVEVDADRAGHDHLVASRIAAAGDGDRRVAEVGARDGGGAGCSSARPMRPGSRTSTARSQRSGASWLSGWRRASGRRCSRTMSRTRTSWSTGERPACTMAVISRSASPTPTSRVGSSIGVPVVVVPWTMRATSRPSTSPRTMPSSTTTSRSAVDQQLGQGRGRRRVV